MAGQGVLRALKNLRVYFVTCIFLLPLTTMASFIESTIGTAVVNDATATYNNPAALTLLKNTQVVTLASFANFRTRFNGQLTELSSGNTQLGSSNSRTNYFLPSFYLGIPNAHNVTLGFGIIYNNFAKDILSGSLLRYVQSNNHIKNFDLIPAIGIKLNEFFALGAGLNFSYADFLLKPLTGAVGLSNPDTLSRNQSNGSGWGGHAGFLIKPAKTTLIGFNYRTSMTYRLSGKSTFESTPSVVSRDYRFKFWTPARSVLSVNHFVTKALGFIGTIQYLQWNIFKDVKIQGLATRIGTQPIILASVNAPFHFHNAWLLTFGTHYRVTPDWIIRVAGTYNQSPSNPRYQIGNGDSLIVGGSTGYDVNKNFSIDFSYAHAFIKNQNIGIRTVRNLISGVNQGFRDVISLKLTFNL